MVSVAWSRAEIQLAVGDHWGTNSRAKSDWRSRLQTKKRAHRAGFSEAADGTRTHDLLHGKQKLSSWQVQGSPANRPVSANPCRAQCPGRAATGARPRPSVRIPQPSRCP